MARELIRMKTISFSCIEKLNKLLAKKCSQTVRPLWNKLSKEREHEMLVRVDAIRKVTKDKIDYFSRMKEAYEFKLPRLVVGDKVKLYWKMRSKHKIFCSKCGEDLAKPEEGHAFVCGKDRYFFNKILGTGTITEVFDIEMGKGDVGIWIKTELNSIPQMIHINDDWIENIAKLDGFNSAEDFFHYFDSHYDLSQPKRFFVVRWVWD